MGDDFDAQEDNSLPPITSETQSKSMFEFDSLIDNVMNVTDPYTNENITLVSTTTNNTKESNGGALRSMAQSNGHHNGSHRKSTDALKNDVNMTEFNAFDANCFSMQSQSQSKSGLMQSQATNGQT